MTTDIVVHLPVNGRKHEFKMALKGLDRLLDEFAALGYTSHVVVGGSGQSDHKLAKEFGHEYIHLKNHPVGKKFNDLAKHIVRNHQFDWYMEFCSDNVISPGYAKLVHEQIQSGATGVALRYFYCVELRGTACKKFGPGCSNVGRFTKRQAVVKEYRKTGELYPAYRENKLDAAFRRRMVKNWGVEYAQVDSEDNVMLIDVKGAVNINPMSNFRAYPSVPLEGEFPEYYEINRAWPQQEKSGPIKSASTSPQPSIPTTTQTSAELTETAQQTNRTPLNSSPAQPAAASPRRRKSSKRRPKTTTAKGKS